METVRHAIDWFEIPVQDIDRAQSFYEALLAAPMRRETIAGQTLAVFDHAETGVGGCLIAGPNAPRPAEAGTLVYLNPGCAIEVALAANRLSASWRPRSGSPARVSTRRWPAMPRRRCRRFSPCCRPPRALPPRA